MWPFKTEIVIRPKYYRIRSPKKNERILFVFEGIPVKEDLEWIRQKLLNLFPEKTRGRIGLISGPKVKIIKQK